MRHISLSRFLVVTLLLVGVTTPTSALAILQSSIRIDQVSPNGLGTWTLLQSDGTSKTSASERPTKSTSFSITSFGPLTFSVTPPKGMSVKISIYRNQDLTKVETSQQFSFTPFPNEAYRFVLQYAAPRTGSLGVTSSPSGTSFRVKHQQTGKTYSSTTPFTFAELPIGKYTVYASSNGTCTQPPAQGSTVEEGRRNTVHISLVCGIDTLSTPERSRVTKRSLVESVYKREAKPIGQKK